MPFPTRLLLLALALQLIVQRADAQVPPSAVPPAADLAKARAAAEASPLPPLSISPVVRLRLNPDLDDAGPEVRALIDTYPYLRVAEPADYAIDTLPEYPNTLQIGRSAPPAGERSDPGSAAETIATMGLPDETLGNLVLKDYPAAFAKTVGRIGWVRALMALGNAPAARPPTLCLTTSTFGNAGPLRCALGGGLREINDTGFPTRFMNPPTLTVAVRNEAVAPQYLYVAVIRPDFRVDVIVLNEGRPVAPGAWAEKRDGPSLAVQGVVLVTIASAQALPAELLTADAFAASAETCRGQLASRLCGRPDPASTATDWSATTTYLPVSYQSPSAIGGGLPVLDLSAAPFMAQLYSTVPFTPQEIAADKKKPFDEKLFLAERSAAERDHRCGGSLIAPDLVLLAAHCVAKEDFAGANAILVLKRRRVRIGTLDLEDRGGGTSYAIDAIAVHAGYRSGLQPDDIALLHIRSDRGTLGFIRAPVPVALARPRDGLPAATPVTAFGWGYTGVVAPGARSDVDQSGSIQHNPTRLRYGRMQTLDWTSCRKRMGAVLRGNMLCAVPWTGSVTTLIPGLRAFSCVGDSGGPLVRDRPGGPVLVGVTSWSRGCSASDANASVYTNVARYADWITAARGQLAPGRAIFVDRAGKVVLSVAAPPPVSPASASAR